jgi:hypothetical protein
MQILCNEVVEASLLANYFCRERDLVIEIEVRIRRRNPFEIPAHPLRIRSQPAVWSPRNSDHGYVSLVEVHNYSIEIVS